MGSPEANYHSHGHSRRKPTLTSKFIVVTLSSLVLGSFLFQFAWVTRSTPEGILKSQLKVYEDGMRRCQAIAVQPFFPAYADEGRSNPRRVEGAKPVLIMNATVLDGDGKATYGASVLLEDGLVTKVVEGKIKDVPKGTIKINARHRYLTPGLVDMHSHVGVDSLPELWGVDDTNEMTSAITSQMRSLDGINPSDQMFLRIASGGVTTSLVLPGSANNMGGEAFAVKHRVPESLRVEDMLVQHNITEKPWRWMKMACGENPKRVYPNEVNTRMGESWAFRHRFEQAQKLMQKQEAWCAAASSLSPQDIREPFPSDLELESVVGVLRGDVRVNIHCYETMDLEARLRESAEFGFQIRAFHHGLDAWRVPQMMKDANLTIATFSSLWGYKKEAYQASVYAGKILSEHGVPVAYKSDHPVLNAQDLIHEARVGHHFGLAEDLAFAAVTGTPAKALGLSHRVGFLREGYDADVVLWDAHPLTLGAKPVEVWIDGVFLFDVKAKTLDVEVGKVEEKALPKQRQSEHVQAKSCQVGQENIIVTGLTKAFFVAEEDELTAAQESGSEPFSMVIRNGSIACIGTCDTEVAAASTFGVPVIRLQNGHVLPGITALTTALGLSEIESEDSTRDGEVDSSKNPIDPKSVVYARDGLVFDGLHIDRAYKNGVLNAITAPSSEGFLEGVSVAFRTRGKSVLDPAAVIKEEAALHFTIGQGGKDDSLKTVSSQIAALRSLLKDNEGKENVYGKAASGALPILIKTHNKDVIAHLIALKKVLSSIKLVIIGGIESYLVAKDLAEADVPVILTAWRCQPETWESRHCLPGPPMTAETALQILIDANVTVALAQPDDGLLGQLYWEAGWASHMSGNLDEKEAVALVSTNVEKILGLDVKRRSDFVIYEGNPLDFGASVVVVLGDGVQACWPEVE
ncbi:hypothetical protein YB2330_004404 [Saitoella coloradoensis]